MGALFLRSSPDRHDARSRLVIRFVSSAAYSSAQNVPGDAGATQDECDGSYACEHAADVALCSPK